MELEDVGSSGHLKMTAMLKTVGSDLKHFTAKTREKGGRRGLSPWSIRCLSQTLFYREERMLRLLRGVYSISTFNDFYRLFLSDRLSWIFMDFDGFIQSS